MFGLVLDKVSGASSSGSGFSAHLRHRVGVITSGEREREEG